MSAQPGELFVFQVGVWALRSNVADIKVEFSDLQGSKGHIIDAGRMTCYNTEGVGFKGNSFEKSVAITAGRIQALLMGVDLEGVDTGNYTGSVTVSSGDEKQALPVRLNVSGKIIPNHGYNAANRLSRLNWLNSTVGITVYNCL